MTSDELHRVATIAKAEMIIELLWTHLYDTDLSYHHEDGEQGYMGGAIRMVLDQMDGLMDEMVEREEVHDDPRDKVTEHVAMLKQDIAEALGDTIAGVDFSNAINKLNELGDVFRGKKE